MFWIHHANSFMENQSVEKGRNIIRTHENRHKNTSWKGADGKNPIQELLHHSSADRTD
jgi:hypothetical protein